MKDLHTLDQYRLRHEELQGWGELGNSRSRKFKVYIGGRSFRVIATSGCGWEHVSVSPFHLKRCPTWEEMCAVKNLFFEPEERVVQYHPPESEYVNMHPYCLHLWRPTGGVEFPHPPAIMVGLLGKGNHGGR